MAWVIMWTMQSLIHLSIYEQVHQKVTFVHNLRFLSFFYPYLTTDHKNKARHVLVGLNTDLKKHDLWGKEYPQNIVLRRRPSHGSNKPSNPCSSIHSVQDGSLTILWTWDKQANFFAQDGGSRTPELLAPRHGLAPARQKPACLNTD